MLEKILYACGFRILLPDLTIDQIIEEERGSHDDGSAHDFEAAMAMNGNIEKCTLCGAERSYDADSE